MINLLPQKDIKRAKDEVNRRIIILSGLAVCFLLCLHLIFSALSLFLVNSYKKDYSQQIASSKNLVQIKNLQKIEQEIARLNNLLSLFENNRSLRVNVSEATLGVLKDLNKGVKINLFNFESIQSGKTKGRLRITLGGFANTRDNFLAFLNKLKTDSLFESVESPVSNILTERDIDFSLSLIIKPNE